jgi:asparagine synthase (glutamine-hydrolysing)
LADPAALNVFYISQLAREQGIKVLLSGTAGDDLFTGYRRHRALQFEKYWRWLPLSVRAFAKDASASMDQRRAVFRKTAKLLSGAVLDGDARIVEYFRWTAEPDLLALYTPAFRALLSETRAATPMLDFLKPLPAQCLPLERMLALEQRFFLADHNLIYTDKMSMATGVEVRVPFLDLDLVDFAATIPLGMKQRGAEGKWILKRAMEPYLPRDIIYRPKSGFGVPLRRWMRADLRELVGDLLSQDSLRRRGIFDATMVHRLIKANDLGAIDASYTLFSILCIEIWCRNFVDKTPQLIQCGK